jgi:hypothetical protein
VSAEHLLELARVRGLVMGNDAGVLRFSGPRAALDELLPDLVARHDELLELLQGVRPGEPDRTEAAAWPCDCCQRFFTEDELADGWCPICMAAVIEAAAVIRENPGCDAQTVLEKHGPAIAQFLRRP